MRNILPSASVVFLGAALNCFAASSPNNFALLIASGEASLNKGDIASATNFFKAACTAESAKPRLALCAHEFGMVAEAQKQTSDAEGRYNEALGYWRSLPGQYPDQHATTLINLAGIYRQIFRNGAAEKALSEAMDLTRSGKGLAFLTAETRLGALYGETDRTDQARLLLDDAVQGLRGSDPATAQQLAAALSARGMIDLGAGLYAAGESNLREAVRLASASLGEDDVDTAAYSTNLALALILEGQQGRAEPVLRRTQFLLESKLGPDTVPLATALSELCTVETALGKTSLAEADGRRAMEILQRRLPAANPGIALAQVNLASVFLRQHNVPAAEQILPAAVEAERAASVGGRALADGLRRLAELRALESRWQEATANYAEAISIYETRLGPRNPELAPILLAYADALKHRGASKTEIRTVETRARALGTEGHRS